MSQKLIEVLTNKEINYLFPLYWQRGEGGEVIRKEMEQIDEAGIKGVIIEARPHPDFLGYTWWNEVDVIMEEAKARGMKVWAFDDDHFPTGRAAGQVMNAPLDLQRWFLAERHIDSVGPMKNSSFLIDPWLKEGENLVSVLAAKRDKLSSDIIEEIQDIKHLVRDGVLYWDIPEGFWRIFIIVETMHGASKKQEGYLNPLVAESTQILIDTVYQEYLNRYRSEFGKTFAGFFSDEPGFYNDMETFNFESSVGIENKILPWRPGMLEILNNAVGYDIRKQLPLLWYEGGEGTTSIRYSYMNLISQLYSENYCGVLANWCREHNVEYIGHVVEDNNVHARLGPGTGHFFRSMWEQDMSGIDVVLNQIIPGFDEASLSWFGGNTDSEFFHYGLAKLGSSLGHLDPKKKGRTICEVFGAYGWHEGLKLMKWITDHMLVRGVNYFIPHAYSQKEFPDPDCPPHFYAQGENPQHRYYRVLNDYTNRLSHLFNGGRHIASAAILYHAEAEWSGESMLVQEPIKQLLQSQIDCDIVPVEIITGMSEIKDRKLIINNENFDSLIVPYAEALPNEIISRILEMLERDFPVFFVDGLPSYISETGIEEKELQILKDHPNTQIIALEELAKTLKKLNLYEIDVQEEQKYLRFYHYQHSDLDIYMFFNESPYDAIETKVSIPLCGEVAIYDAFENKVLQVDTIVQEERTELNLNLQAYESTVFIVGDKINVKKYNSRDFYSNKVEKILTGEWRISTATSKQYPYFKEWGKSQSLQNMSAPELLPSFTGTFKYEIDFDFDEDVKYASLDLGEVYEVAEMWVNGKQAGVKICPPYRLDLTGLINKGENKLVIEVTNTLVKKQKDYHSIFVQQEPSGLLGPVRLVYSK